MADPLGLISGSGGASPLQPRSLPGGGTPTDPNAPSFKDYLLENLQEVNKLQQDATQATEDLLAGRRDDPESVIIATQKADTAFRMLLQVRNKVMDAYDEIRQIRV
jgi:flagellar hook-basal body complex protein FliE